MATATSGPAGLAMERRVLQGIKARAVPPFRSRSGPDQGATVSMPVPYPLQLELHADLHITRWRPLVQWLLAIPHLMIAYALRFVRQALTLISFFTVLFTEQIPRPLFDAIVMTYRYEWRAMSYAFFMHEDYPPFDFDLSSEADGAEPHTSLRLTYPGHLERWQPLYKWFLALPQYFRSGLPPVRVRPVLRGRRRRTPHLAAPDLSRAPGAVAAAVQVVPGHTPVLRAGRPGHRGGPGPHRRLVRRAVHRGSTPRASGASWSAPTATRYGSRPTSVSSPTATRPSASPRKAAASPAPLAMDARGRARHGPGRAGPAGPLTTVCPGQARR